VVGWRQIEVMPVAAPAMILFPAVEGSESSAKLDWAPLSTDLQEAPNG